MMLARPLDQGKRRIVVEFNKSIIGHSISASLLTSLAKDTPACFLPHELTCLVEFDCR